MEQLQTTLWPRVILGSLAIGSICFPGALQPAVSWVYSFLYNSSFYQLSSFETIETVFFYALIELSFTYKFAHSPDLRLDQRHAPTSSKSCGTDLPKMLRPKHRKLEILTYIAPLLAMDLTMIKKFHGVSVPAIRESGNYRPFPDGYIDSNYTSANGKVVSAHFLLPTLHNFTASSPLQTRRALPMQAPTARQLVTQLMLAFAIYDTLFFLFHLSLHRIPALRALHIPHHKHKEIHPQVTNKLSVFERLGLVLLANFSLNIIGSHVLTRTLFVPIFVWLLVEIHSGLDLPWGYEKVLPVGMGLGAKEHARHHREGEFGDSAHAPFFAWNDAILKLAEGRKRTKLS